MTISDDASRFPARPAESSTADTEHTHVAAGGLEPGLPACTPRDFGPYQLLQEIGRGGMGVVYQAWQPGLKRLVALKVILAGDCASADDLDRFQTEARAVASLQHPNIVQIYEVGEHAGRPYLALEYVDGGNLDQQCVASTLKPDRAAQLVQALARAVQHAHQHGVVHRDLKPANILLTADGTPKIADFGLAKRVGGDHGDPTLTAAILGTPSYMAPELTEGKPHDIGAAADIYALGAILYETLTGRPPIRGESPLDTLAQVRAHHIVAPRRLQPELSRDLETICLKCLRREPDRRYPSAQALADDLERYLAGRPIHARPAGPGERLWKWARRRPAVASLLACLLGLGAAVFATVTVLWWQTAAALEETEAAGAREAAQRRRADDARAAAAAWDEKTRDALYHSKLLLARYQWEGHQFNQARETLRECDPARREQQWRYLDRMLHSQLWQVEVSDPFSLVFDSTGGRLAVVNISGSSITGSSRGIKMVETASGRELLYRPGEFQQVAFDAVKNRLVILGWGGLRDEEAAPSYGVTVSELPGGASVGGFRPGKGRYLSLSTRGDLAVHVASSSKGIGEELLWIDPLDGRVLHNSGEPSAAATHNPIFSSNGRYFGLMHPSLKAVSLWDTRSKRLLGKVSVKAEFQGEPAVLSPTWAISPQGDEVAVAYEAGKPGEFRSHVRVFDVASGEVTFAVEAHAGRFGSLAFCPGGQRLATAGLDRTIVVWDLRTGKELLTFRFDNVVRDERVSCQLAFSPDGRRLAFATKTALSLWDSSPLEPR
jgi:hypothetical protein